MHSSFPFRRFPPFDIHPACPYNSAQRNSREEPMERENQNAEPRVSLRFIGETPHDLRWFILADGRHAGGITVHSADRSAFSYGVAVTPALRGRGIAGAALSLLFAMMKARGYTRARVRVREENGASLRLHRRLGFTETGKADGIIWMERTLQPWTEETT